MRLALLALVLGLVAFSGRATAAPKTIELKLTALTTERGDGMEEWFSAFDFDRVTLTEKKTASGELHGRSAGDDKAVTAEYTLMAWFQMDGGLAVQGTVKLDNGHQRVAVNVTGRVPSEGAKRVIGRATKAGGISCKVQASFRTP